MSEAGAPPRSGSARGLLAADSAALVAAAMLFVLSCLLGVGGLLDDRPWGDPEIYERYGERMVAGEVPYDDFYVEYPPAGLPMFLLPELADRAAGGLGFLTAFRLLTTLCGLGILVVAAALLRRLGSSRERTLVALGAIAVAPVTLGHVVLNRYDVWPALLLALALLALLAGREAGAGVALGGAFAAKIFPAAVAPVTAVRLVRTGGTQALVRAGTAAVVVAGVAFVVFVAVAPGGVAYSLYTQFTRGLHVESLAGSLLLALRELGVYDARIVAGLAIDLEGAAPDALGVVTTLVQVAAVLAVAAFYLRAGEASERLVTAFAASVTAFVALAKVLSPQYLVWLLPLVPLVGGRTGRRATVLLLVALVLTQIELQGFEGLTIDRWAVWVLLARNIVLVALLFVLLDGLRRAPAAATVGRRG